MGGLEALDPKNVVPPVALSASDHAEQLPSPSAAEHTLTL
jgi:hypothetical protein